MRIGLEFIILAAAFFIVSSTRFSRTSGNLFSGINKEEKIKLNLFIPDVHVSELVRIKRRQAKLVEGRRPPICGERGDYVLCRCPKTGQVKVIQQH
jgi:hypothetical protein